MGLYTNLICALEVWFSRHSSWLDYKFKRSGKGFGEGSTGNLTAEVGMDSPIVI